MPAHRQPSATIQRQADCKSECAKATGQHSWRSSAWKNLDGAAEAETTSARSGARDGGQWASPQEHDQQGERAGARPQPTAHKRATTSSKVRQRKGERAERRQCREHPLKGDSTPGCRAAPLRGSPYLTAQDSKGKGQTGRHDATTSRTQSSKISQGSRMAKITHYREHGSHACRESQRGPHANFGQDGPHSLQPPGRAATKEEKAP